MKKFHLKFFVIFTFLLFPAAILFSQNSINLDSLEKKINELRNTNPYETIKIGEKILKYSTSKTQKSNTLALMSIAYFAKKDTKKSIELLFKSKEIAEETGDPKIIAKIYGTITQMYRNIGFNDKAEFYLHKTIDEIQKLPAVNDKFRLSGLSNLELGKLKVSEKEYKKANIYFRKSLSGFNRMDHNAPYFIKRSYYNIGFTFYSIKNSDSAYFYLEKALVIKQNKAVNPYISLTLSKLYIEEKQYKRAIDTLNTILKSTELNDDLLKSDIYFSISNAYSSMGDDQHFKIYNERYLALKEQISNNNLGTIKNAVKNEEKNLTNKISSVQKRNERLFFGILFISFFAIVVFLQIRQKKIKQKKQYEKIIDLLKLKAKEIDFPKNTDHIKEVHPSLISSYVEREILEKLTKFEQSDKFINAEMNISILSIQLKTNTTYLSKIINKYKGKNFNTYINELRINYICEKIHHNPEYLNYKISHLGELAGFSSHSFFTTVFKSITGMSPSIFLKETENNSKLKKQI